MLGARWGDWVLGAGREGGLGTGCLVLGAGREGGLGARC